MSPNSDIDPLGRIGPSKHPHSIDALMREARGLLRAAGAFARHNAGDFVLYAGVKAYEAMADWLKEDEPTVNLTPLRYGEKLADYEMVVERASSPSG